MFLLDSNVFIEAKNRYYAFDLAPGFWEWLDDAVDTGTVASTESVGQELIRGDDELARWAKRRPELFRSPDSPVLERLAALADWAIAAEFSSAAVHRFLSVADCFLVAHAAAHGHTIVTHERPHEAAKNRIPIPNAARALGAPWCSSFTMLRVCGVRLALDQWGAEPSATAR